MESLPGVEELSNGRKVSRETLQIAKRRDARKTGETQILSALGLAKERAANTFWGGFGL
jgi:hypothetical protein